MSFNDDLYSQSETRKIITARDKIRVDLWPDQEIEQSLWCPVCRVKLKFEDNGRTLWCKECGKHTPSTEVKHEKKLRSKFPKSNSGNPIVISQPKKSKRERPTAVGVNANLSEEDLKELRGMGFNV
jgi:hypothetical protein